MYKFSKVDNRLYEQLQSDLRKNCKKKRVYVPIAIFHEESISAVKLSRKKSVKERLLHAISFTLK